ncbi:MAG TPA: hypothetical protein VG125_13960, partial [Pirellulales bacterium]|nr:hypothetical protein [Pirellulales bacterium]
MATKLWTGNSLAVAQIQTYAPGPQLPNTVITATINGKTASYTSLTGSNDDLVAGLINAVAGIVQQAPEFAEVSFGKVAYVPAVPSPNSLYLQMSSKVAGVPFTVSISLTTPAKVTVSRIAAGKAAVNEVQQITISPNAESGSSFTLTWSGHTTNAIPTPASACTSAVGASGVLTGAYLYAVTFVTNNGETEAGLPSASLTLAAQQGSLSAIPLGPAGTTKRKIYRTKSGGGAGGPYYLLTTINDNTTTTYTDNTADGSLSAESPPLTNGVLQGELEALTGVGQGNVKVSGTGVAAVSGQTMPTSPIVYTIEFRGTLGAASQALVSGTVTGITILPPVSVVVSQVGCPPQSEIQTVGWKQVNGVASPTGGFTITLPGLNVTTASIVFNASAATVQAALVAAAGATYASAFTVTLTQSTNAGYLYQIVYNAPLNLQAVPLATVNVANLVAAAGDTVTGYQAETQKGTSTGRNSIITVSLLNGPSGGTFGLTGTLANAGTITATGVPYNATAATVQGDFPANTAVVSGSAGGPYTIEAIGEAGGQNVTWTATSSLTGGSSSGAGSPPGSNTTGLSAPTGVFTNPNNGGGFGAGTYYYVVTATDAAGETAGSAEVHWSYLAPSGGNAAYNVMALQWTAVHGATGYKIYRGTSSG